MIVRTDTSLNPAFGLNTLTNIRASIITVAMRNCGTGAEPAVVEGSDSWRKLLFPRTTPTEPNANTAESAVSEKYGMLPMVHPANVITLPTAPFTFLETQT